MDLLILLILLIDLLIILLIEAARNLKCMTKSNQTVFLKMYSINPKRQAKWLYLTDTLYFSLDFFFLLWD